jgi:catechol 2,3-dioxygenase-like lactoylglutathione lyase family enzyme
MKLLNLQVGCNDLAKASAFYDATFGVLGVDRAPMPAEYQIAMYRCPDGLNFLVAPPRDGNPATHANGGTILFGADSQEQVREWHAAGLVNGGSCEGPPEAKPRAPHAFGAYLRDPDGNKLAVFYNLYAG